MSAVPRVGMPRSSGFARAFGSALGLEALAIAALVAWLAVRPPAAPNNAVPLSIEPAVAEPEKPQPRPEPPKPVPEPPRVQPKLVAVPVPPPPAPPAPETVVTAAPAALPIAPPVHTPAVHAPVAAQVVAPPPPPPVAAEADPMPAYSAQLAAAAQAAFALPQVAIDLNFKGRARIGFNMRDGVPSGITVVQGSGLGVVDRAATKAVQSAKFPLPTAALRGKDIAYLIWVSAY